MAPYILAVLFHGHSISNTNEFYNLLGKFCDQSRRVGLSRDKYLSLFPAPVQGKVLNFDVFGEEFLGL